MCSTSIALSDKVLQIGIINAIERGDRLPRSGHRGGGRSGLSARLLPLPPAAAQTQGVTHARPHALREGN